jgi:DNA-binding transcriptional ArsR family regulator
MPTKVERNADRFQALGNPVRLSILRIIVQGHKGGTPVGEILAKIGIPGSTLSHHLSCLAKSGLARVEREGSTLRYRADFPNLHKLTDYLWEDCCKGGASEPAPACGSGCATVPVGHKRSRGK